MLTKQDMKEKICKIREEFIEDIGLKYILKKNRREQIIAAIEEYFQRKDTKEEISYPDFTVKLKTKTLKKFQTNFTLAEAMFFVSIFRMKQFKEWAGSIRENNK